MTTTDDPTCTDPAPPVGPGEAADLGLHFDPRHFGIDPGDPWPDDVPQGQDDSHWRFENDPKGARRAELRIAFCWTLTVLASIGLAMASTWPAVRPRSRGSAAPWPSSGSASGSSCGPATSCPATTSSPAGAITTCRAEADRQAVAESLSRGIEPMARRPFLFKMLGAVGGVFGLAALFPFASLGPRPHDDLDHTKWGKGIRAVTVDGTPMQPERHRRQRHPDRLPRGRTSPTP